MMTRKRACPCLLGGQPWRARAAGRGMTSVVVVVRVVEVVPVVSGSLPLPAAAAAVIQCQLLMMPPAALLELMLCC